MERNGWASPGKAHHECSAMLEGCSRLRAGGARLEPVDMGVAAPGEPKGVRRVRASESPGSLLDVPPGKAYIGGVSIIDAPAREGALEWAAKIAVACRCVQEVREFLPDPAGN